MDFKFLFIGIGFDVRAVGVEHIATDQTVLNGLPHNLVKYLLFDIGG